MEVLDQFVVDIVQSTLLSESHNNTMSINQEVASPAVINIKFNYSYKKPSAILRMVESFLSPALFRTCLHIYLLKRYEIII